MTPDATVEFTALVVIDWADRKHDICLQALPAETRERAVLEHRPEAIGGGLPGQP